MKRFAPLAAIVGALLLPTAASALDLQSPSADIEARELSERLHVSAGMAAAFGSLRTSVAPTRREVAATIAPNRSYDDLRERALRGNDD